MFTRVCRPRIRLTSSILFPKSTFQRVIQVRKVNLRLETNSKN
eukprot:01889.XXX_19942_2208_1 [CDS] Oithona nana genome sequencing.